ncbi:MAG: hypothetical protein V7K57_10385 [Nostoc sp.]|uniref:hypothetical protein n=1 Tax=Nostoc sp. TaxID=1180 RepID=UPI002FF8041A
MDSPITSIIINLFKKLYGMEPTTNVIESIHQIVESNGLGSSSAIPNWFIDFWQSILNQKTTNKEYFLISEIVNKNTDIINFLAELTDVIDMNYENYGEGIVMDFKPLNLNVFICLEGGASTCFYQIKNSGSKNDQAV